MYSPERDLAHTLVPLAELIPRILNAGQAPGCCRDHLQATKVPQAEVDATIQALLDSLGRCLDPDVPDVRAAFEAGGFWDRPEAAQLPVLASLALLVAGKYFADAREATYGVRGPKLVLASEGMMDQLAAGREVLRKESLLGRILRGKVK